MEVQEKLFKPLSHLLKNSSISEILVNRPEEIWVEEHGGLRRIEDKNISHFFLKNLFQVIANSNKQVLNDRLPLLSGNLFDGTRVQLVIPPASQNLAMSIRRKTTTNISLADLPDEFFKIKKTNKREDNQTLMDLYKKGQWREFIAQSVRLKKNIVVSGGTSSGKTTFLNALIKQIKSDERIITMEDTKELEIQHPNHLSLFAKKGSGSSVSNINMQDLVQASLRLRPDRIIMGEVRGKEILDFISAASTGHEGSMISLHADCPQRAFLRMKQMYKLNNVPSMTDENILEEIHDVVDVIVQLQKDPERGRCIKSIYFNKAEIEIDI